MNLYFDLDGTILDVKRRYCEIYWENKRNGGGIIDPENPKYLKHDTVIRLPHDGIIVTRRKNAGETYKQLESLGISLQIIFSDDKYGFLKGKDGVMFGDTGHDIESAKRAGLVSVGVLSGLSSRLLMETYNPDFIFEDLNEAFNSTAWIRAYRDKARKDTQRTRS